MPRSTPVSRPLARSPRAPRPDDEIKLSWQQVSVKGMLLRKKDHVTLSPLFLSRLIIGQNSYCDQQIFHPAVASYHAIIFFDDGEWYIVGLNPTGHLSVSCADYIANFQGRQLIKRGCTINLSDEFSIAIS